MQLSLKKSQLITISLLFSVLLLSTPSIVFARPGAPTPIPSGGSFYPDTCSSHLPSSPSLKTAIGCIPTEPLALISKLITILIDFGGGIAFLLMIIGAAFILTSRGNPEAVARGKEVFTGAVIGLLFIIFSTFLLELIGVDILGIFPR